MTTAGEVGDATSSNSPSDPVMRESAPVQGRPSREALREPEPTPATLVPTLKRSGGSRMERPAGLAPAAPTGLEAGVGLAIETARPGDAVAIAALDAVAWSDGAHPERIPDGEHVWRVWIDGAWVFVARERGALVGAIVAFPVLGGELFVHKVMVAVEYRRRGIGTRLFRPSSTKSMPRRAPVASSPSTRARRRRPSLRSSRLHREGVRRRLLPGRRGPLRDAAPVRDAARRGWSARLVEAVELRQRGVRCLDQRAQRVMVVHQGPPEWFLVSREEHR